MTVSRAHSTGGRLDFIRLVTDAFEQARVEYVVLHGYDDRPSGKDSDLDIAVSRRSLSTVDVIVRSGRFGRLLQRFDYDVPWYRYYVLESHEPDRRYRQLDIACDPWGIGRYGRTVPVAVAHAERDAGFARPNAAAETYYLAVKRAQKPPTDAASLEGLRAAFERDPAGSSRLLLEELGHVGAALAAALAVSGDLAVELRAVAESVARRRLTGPQLVRWARFSAVRVARRMVRPTGLVVCLAGPDGSGKSTLATGLDADGLGAFRQSVRLHSRPGVLPSPQQLLGRPAHDTTDPHSRSPSGTVGSAARVGYLWLDYVLGWPIRVWKPRVRSSLVILERGWLDLCVDPRRYRLTLPQGLTRGIGVVLPKPDLTLVLDAPASQVATRKPELSAFEADRQRGAWRALAREPRSGLSLIDAAKPAAQVLEETLGTIHAGLAARQPDFGGAVGAALECIGRHDPDGSPFVLVHFGGRARWLLPARRGAPGPLRQGLYRPARLRHQVAGLSVDVAHSLGRGYGTALRLDPERGIAPAIADVLGMDSLEIGGVSLSRDGSSRIVVNVMRNGRTIAFAKVDQNGDGLGHERRVLDALARIGPKTFVAPRALGTLEWHDFTVLVTEPLSLRERSDRPMSGREVAALIELADLRGYLAEALGGCDGLFSVHGDFAPWNAGRVKNGNLAIWDWERAHLGHPLEDYFHWHTQRLVLFSAGTIDSLVRRSLQPGRDLRALCASLAVAPEEAPSWLRSYLERSVASLSPTSPGALVRVRAIDTLDRAGA